MRMVPVVLLALLAVGCDAASPNDAASPCDVPVGCVRADRTAGVCGCSEWTIVDEQEIALKYVVVSVLYPMAGNASGVQYGGVGADPFYEASYAPVGVRLRASVRSGDGAESIVPVRRADGGGGPWTLRTVTPASVLVSAPPGIPMIHRSVSDIPRHERDDRLLVWVNPRAVLVTDYADGKMIDWAGIGTSPPECGADSFRVVVLSPAQVSGTAPIEDPCASAFFATLSSSERADIRSHDGFLDPPGRLWDGFFDDPRFTPFRNMSVYYFVGGPRQTVAIAETWWPVEPPSDGDRAILRRERPLAGGDTLVLDHLAVAGRAGATRTLGYVIDTASEGCLVSGAIELDTVFGTAAMMASADWTPWWPAACTLD